MISLLHSFKRFATRQLKAAICPVHFSTQRLYTWRDADEIGADPVDSIAIAVQRCAGMVLRARVKHERRVAMSAAAARVRECACTGLTEQHAVLLLVCIMNCRWKAHPSSLPPPFLPVTSTSPKRPSTYASRFSPPRPRVSSSTLHYPASVVF